MYVQQSASVLAALALVVTGCTTTNAAPDAGQRPEPSRPAAQRVVAVEAYGVEPCSRLPVMSDGGDVVGERLTELTLPCLTGGPVVNLAQLGGRPVVINLWATWCGPCREEMPILQDAYERLGEHVSFVGVNTKDDPDSAAAFLEAVGVSYPQLVDVDGQLLAHLHTPGLPVTVVLDPSGRVTNRHVGPLTSDELRDLVEAASGTTP